jgi:hypothetical protein
MPNAAAQRPRLVRADSQLRNKWLLATGFLLVVVLLLFWGSPLVQNNLVQMFSDDGKEHFLRLLVIFYSLFSILAIILITIGMHLIQVAREILQSKRFPAPGMRVLHDTWVVRGNKALILSYFFISIALVLIVGGGTIPVYFHNLLVELLEQV